MKKLLVLFAVLVWLLCVSSAFADGDIKLPDPEKINDEARSDGKDLHDQHHDSRQGTQI